MFRLCAMHCLWGWLIVISQTTVTLGDSPNNFNWAVLWEALHCRIKIQVGVLECPDIWSRNAGLQAIFFRIIVGGRVVFSNWMLLYSISSYMLRLTTYFISCAYIFKNALKMSIQLSPPQAWSPPQMWLRDWVVKAFYVNKK